MRTESEIVQGVPVLPSTGLQRICFLLQVKPDRLEEYRRRHQAVWPEMLQALREAGWQNYSLFLREDGLLIGYLEASDFERARQQMTGSEVNRRWQAQMADFFVNPRGSSADEQMSLVPEIFHLP